MADQSQIIGPIAFAAVRPRPVWSSHQAYILSTVAGVVGLGAIWRFPYLVGEHGGGAFVLAYLICTAGIALPFAIIESSAGRMAGVSPIGLFRQLLGRQGRWLGWTIVCVGVVLMSYYYAVTGWTLGYFVDSLRGDVQVFREFTAGYAPLWWFLAVGVGAYLILLRGVGALEKASRLMMPLLVVGLVGLAAYAQTTAGAREAAEFYITVEPARLADAGTWRAAAGQAFYQSGVGQGFLIAYASYSPAGLNLAKSSLILAVANVTVALVAMLVVFPIIFTFGIAPDAGAQLAFTAFPRILGDITGGEFLSIAFFGLLFVAAFTSCLAGSAVPIAAMRDEIGLGPRAAAAATVALVLILGLPSALSHTPVAIELGGEPVLDRVDQLAGSALVIAVGLVSTAVIAWKSQRRSLLRAMRLGRLRRNSFQPSGGTVIWIARLLAPAGLVALGASVLI